jgi:hypothetical protein
MQATRSSEYLLTPWNSNEVRTGWITRFGGGGCRLSPAGRNRWDRNSSHMRSRLVNTERQVAVASDETYKE